MVHSKFVVSLMNRLFRPELVRIVDRFADKNSCLEYMAGMLAETGCLSFPDRFVAAVKGREEIMSTGIGREIAIPHARDLTVSCLQIAVCMTQEAIVYQSIDNLPVRIIFMIAVPQSSNQQYMRILRSLSEYLRQEENRQQILNASSEEELFQYVHKIEDIIISNLTNLP